MKITDTLLSFLYELICGACCYHIIVIKCLARSLLARKQIIRKENYESIICPNECLLWLVVLCSKRFVNCEL